MIFFFRNFNHHPLCERFENMEIYREKDELI